MKARFRTAVVLLAALTGVTALMGGCAEREYGTEMNDTFYNPVILTGNDPWYYKNGEYYYYIHSVKTERNGESVSAIAITRSKQLTTLYPDLSDPEVTHVVGAYADLEIQSVWAPEMFFFGEHWYLLFTAVPLQYEDVDGEDGARRTFIMKSAADDAFGEYSMPIKLELPQDKRSIDATFMDYGGKQYIIWSGWPNAVHTAFWTQNLYITELVTGDPTTVKDTSDDARYLISEPKAVWERQGASQNEGPCVTFAPDGTPVLFFSASYSGSNGYCIGYLKLTGEDPLRQSDWEKCENPLMETDLVAKDVISPGHNSVVKSPDGTEDWIVYHAAKYSGAGWNRTVRLQKLTWEGNTPVAELSAWTEELALPSGEITEKVRYEAEDTKLPKGCSVRTFEEGEGFAYASGNKAVGFSQDGAAVTVSFQAKRAGKAMISFRYSNAQDSAGETVTEIAVNGTERELAVPYTCYEELFTLSQTLVDLSEGKNVVTFSGKRNLLLDCIIVTYL